METSQPPLFFQKLTSFFDELPEASQSSVNSPLLNNYLNHYAINFANQGSAKHHEIWRSNIGPWQIAQQRWHPHNTNGKTLIICHGYFDHTGLYGNLIQWGIAHGYQVHCFDLPGHGLSSGDAVAIDHFDQYTEVLADIIARESYDNYVLVGQSTGCSVILNYLLNNQLSQPCKTPPQKAVLLAPLIRIHYWPLLRWLYKLMCFFKTHWQRSFVDSSHDQQFNHFLQHNDPLQSRQIPLSWMGAMDQWAHQCVSLTPQEKLSCIIIQGTGDTTVDFRHNLKVIRRKLPNTVTHLIKGARHHLVKESEFYWQQVRTLLDKYL